MLPRKYRFQELKTAWQELKLQEKCPVLIFFSMTITLAIECESPSLALSELTQGSWNFTGSKLRNIIGGVNDSFQYIYGDQITYICAEGYIFTNKETSRSFTCLQNETMGIWQANAKDAFGCVGMKNV